LKVTALRGCREYKVLKVWVRERDERERRGRTGTASGEGESRGQAMEETREDIGRCC
jgi:hypothetical protein